MTKTQRREQRKALEAQEQQRAMATRLHPNAGEDSRQEHIGDVALDGDADRAELVGDQRTGLLKDASSEELKNLLEKHGVESTLSKLILVDRTKKIIGTIAVLNDMEIDFDKLELSEAEELNSPDWMVQFRRNGFREKDIQYLLSEVGISQISRLVYMTSETIKAMPSPMMMRSYLLTLREDLKKAQSTARVERSISSLSLDSNRSVESDHSSVRRSGKVK